MRFSSKIRREKVKCKWDVNEVSYCLRIKRKGLIQEQSMVAGWSQEHKFSVSEGSSCLSAILRGRLRLMDSPTSARIRCRGDLEILPPADGLSTEESRLSADRKEVARRRATSGDDVIAADRKCGVARVDAGCTSSGNDVWPVSVSPALATYIGVRSARHIASFPLPVRDRK